jgi:hypothetical protein
MPRRAVEEPTIVYGRQRRGNAGDAEVPDASAGCSVGCQTPPSSAWSMPTGWLWWPDLPLQGQPSTRVAVNGSAVGGLTGRIRHAVARRLCSVLLALAATGCAENAAGLSSPAQPAIRSSPPPAINPSAKPAIEHAAFFYPECPKSAVRVRRLSEDRHYLELVVCGAVRHYQDIAPDVRTRSLLDVHEPIWVEVTRASGT